MSTRAVRCGKGIEFVMKLLLKRIAWLAALPLALCAQEAEFSPELFANPPEEVKIGCYYYWVDERVDPEGVRKDLLWMKENGITRAFLATDIRDRRRLDNPWEGRKFG